MRERAEEIVAVTIPILIEVVAVLMFVAMATLWAGIAAGRI
jgi:hypothetical protein